MEEKNIKKLPLTPNLIRLFNELIELQEAKKIVVKPTGFLFKRIDVKALIEICKLYAEAKSNFWIEANRVYPETKNKEASANCIEIKIIEIKEIPVTPSPEDNK